MKILLDGCLRLDFRHSFPGAHTAQWAGLKGKKNGELLQAAEDAGDDILLTVGQGIPRDHDLAGRKLSVIVIRSRTNQLEDLLQLLEAVLEAMRTIQPGQAVVVPSPEQ